MKPMNASRLKLLTLLTLVFPLGMPLSALAEKVDRDKPVNLEADRIVIDDVKKVNVFEGNVQLVQGSLIIRSDKLVVTQDAEGFQNGVATGGPGGLARFRQKREGKNEFVDGEAERIVYDGKAEKTEFFQRARVRAAWTKSAANTFPTTARTITMLSPAALPELPPRRCPARTIACAP